MQCVLVEDGAAPLAKEVLGCLLVHIAFCDTVICAHVAATARRKSGHACCTASSASTRVEAFVDCTK